MITGLSRRNHRVIPHDCRGWLAAVSSLHCLVPVGKLSWGKKVQDQPYSSWWQLPEPWCPTGTVLLLSPPWQVSAESNDSFIAPKKATLSRPASSATPSSHAGLCSEAHPNDHRASYSYAERERCNMAISHVEKPWDPIWQQQGMQQTTKVIKVLKYEAACLFSVISKEPKFGLPIYSQWKKSLSWLSCSFNLYLSLWVRLLMNVDSHTTLPYCLPLNSPSLETWLPILHFE